MSNLKALKLRIDSVKSTKKITQAMKMVAASKLRSARNQAENCRHYSAKLNEIITTAYLAGDHDDLPKRVSLFINGNSEVNIDLFIIFSSDRGLCGGFNTHIIKKSKNAINKSLQEGREVKIITIGNKAKDLLSNDFADKIIKTYNSSNKKVQMEDASQIFYKLSSMIKHNEFGRCFAIFNYFNSAISQEVTCYPLIPNISTQSYEDLASNDNNAVINGDIIFEPSAADILSSLIPKNITIQLYQMLLESYASEQGARMTAMDNAVKNCGELIDKLTLKFNRTRQANITRELIEIISGAESL